MAMCNTQPPRTLGTTGQSTCCWQGEGEKAEGNGGGCLLKPQISVKQGILVFFFSGG
jgi:hypothetical protein